VTRDTSVLSQGEKEMEISSHICGGPAEMLQTSTFGFDPETVHLYKSVLS